MVKVTGKVKPDKIKPRRRAIEARRRELAITAEGEVR